MYNFFVPCLVDSHQLYEISWVARINSCLPFWRWLSGYSPFSITLLEKLVIVHALYRCYRSGYGLIPSFHIFAWHVTPCSPLYFGWTLHHVRPTRTCPTWTVIWTFLLWQCRSPRWNAMPSLLLLIVAYIRWDTSGLPKSWRMS